MIKKKINKKTRRTALLIKAAALAALTGILSGCMFDSSIESLLSPPKLTEVQTAIYNALILNTGNQIELVYPRSGEYRSPFVLYDLDGTGGESSTEEAIVFYREISPQSQNESSLRINILDQHDGKWVSVSDRPLTGIDIESISFHSFFGSSRPDNILVKCTMLGQMENNMYVLEYTGNELWEHFSGRYSIMDIITPTDGSDPKLFWVGRDSTNLSRAYLGGVKAADPTENAEPVFETCTAEIPPYYGDINVQKITKQRLNDNNLIIFLDYSQGDLTYGSTVLSCSLSNLYLHAFYSEDIALRRNNSNTPMLYCTDIDGDGRIDIPVTVPMPGYESLTLPEQIFSVDWYFVDEENNYKITKEFTTYVSLDLEYIFYIPVRWQGLISVERREDGTVWFIKQDPDSPVLLLSIGVASAPPDENDELMKWELYAETRGGNIYICSPSPNDPLTLTADELNRAISPLGEVQLTNLTESKRQRTKKY